LAVVGLGLSFKK